MTESLSTSQRFGVGLCQVGLVFALMAFVIEFWASPLIPGGCISIKHRVPSVLYSGPVLAFSAATAGLLWLYRRRHRGTSLLMGAAFCAVLASTIDPTGVFMVIPFSGACSLVFDEMFPQSRNWNSASLVLTNLLLCGVAIGAGVVGFRIACKLIRAFA